MTNGQINAMLATVLDKAADDRAAASRVMKRFALSQALTAEGEFSEEDKSIVAAAAILYDLNDDAVNPSDDTGKEFKPIVITQFITELLEELYLPTFEVSVIGSLVAMQKHGLKIENKLHRLLLDIQTLVTLDEENADLDRVKEARESMTYDSAKRRLDLMFGLN